MWRLVIIGVCVVGVALSAQAQSVPTGINYQGTLRNANNEPLADGDYKLTFNIYDVSEGSTPVWGPQISGEGGPNAKVPVVGGVFNVILGPTDDRPVAQGGPRAIDTAFAGPDRWLQITVNDGQPLLPRQKILSAPFAMKAKDAMHADSASQADGAVHADHATQADTATLAGQATNATTADNGVPIGTILAWHKSLTGTPALPVGWLECNGQTVTDPNSPYKGQTVPDLNSPPNDGHGHSNGRFLRGSATSGTLEDDRFQGHWHSIYACDGGTGHSMANPGYENCADPWYDMNGMGWRVKSPTNDGTNGTPRTGKETRPISFTVVWIIKVK